MFHDVMIYHARRHSFTPEFRVSLRVPEKIGQLPGLPVLARGPIAVFDELNRRYIGKIFLNRWSEKAQGTITKRCRLKRPHHKSTSVAKLIRRFIFCTTCFRHRPQQKL